MGHIKNTGFFALALTARVVRGSNSSFLLWGIFSVDLEEFADNLHITYNLLGTRVNSVLFGL